MTKISKTKHITKDGIVKKNPISVGEKSITELRKDKRFGIVVMGAGKPYKGWIDGLGESLIKAKIVAVKSKTKVFSSAYILTGNANPKGRTDLVLIFNDKLKINTGKLAMWRLRMGGISWIDDFIVNYGKDYNEDIVDNLEDIGLSKPELNLTGQDGNAFSILGKARKVALKNNMPWETINKEATTGDYDHLLQTMMKYFEVN